MASGTVASLNRNFLMDNLLARQFIEQTLDIRLEHSITWVR